MSESGDVAGRVSDGLLTFKFDNKAPVALDDLTTSLNALAQSYEDYLAASGKAPPEEGIKLYVHDLRTGSIIAVLQALAEQSHLLFGEHGLVPTLQSAFAARCSVNRSDTVSNLGGHAARRKGRRASTSARTDEMRGFDR